MKNKPRFSKGPWEIYREGRAIIEIGPCRAEEYAGACWLEVPEEDAILMSAAKDMYGALCRVIKADAQDGGSEWTNAIRMAEAALAKARGEA